MKTTETKPNETKAWFWSPSMSSSQEMHWIYSPTPEVKAKWQRLLVVKLLRRSGMDHTVLPAITLMPAL